MKFARFGPREGEIAKGGTCLSSFVIIKKNNEVLLGKITQPETWAERWCLTLDHPERWKDKWQIPCSYLKFGEHPDQTAKRIIEEQLQITKYNLNRIMVKSFSGESSIYKGEVHWDICFIYESLVHEEIKPQPWFSELKFIPMSQAQNLEFGRSHGEILAALGKPEL
ncbi:MAG: NUDIX hydrolase [Thaumarchaeota archaeon]|nr:NUDIX hydrolase [Nitrososphaerota archaeon]